MAETDFNQFIQVYSTRTSLACSGNNVSHQGLRAELRDGETIRAYFEELDRMKSLVQLWLPQSDAPPFETTIERLSVDCFITASTPPLPEGQQLLISFLLESRRFTAATQVVSTGTFRIPTCITQGERRERLRAPFNRSDGIRFFAIEHMVEGFSSGRLLHGTLVNLSLQGLRIIIDDLTDMDGAPLPLKRGDSFDAISVQGLPFNPTFYCRGILAHLTPMEEGAAAGFLLMDIQSNDQKNIERILARRFPTTFGQAFPKKKRKTDIADRPGAPVQVPVTTKTTAVVIAPQPTPPLEKAQRPRSSPAMRIRKAGRRILIISGGQEGAASLAEELRQDDFRHVHLCKSFLEAKQAASASHFDLLFLDLKVGGHYGQMILQALNQHGLLLDTPVILVADTRDASLQEVATAIRARHIHDRKDSYDALAPVLYRLLLEEGTV